MGENDVLFDMSVLSVFNESWSEIEDHKKGKNRIEEAEESISWPHVTLTDSLLMSTTLPLAICFQLAIHGHASIHASKPGGGIESQ